MPSPDKCHASEEARSKLASLDEKEKESLTNQMKLSRYYCQTVISPIPWEAVTLWPHTNQIIAGL